MNRGVAWTNLIFVMSVVVGDVRGKFLGLNQVVPVSSEDAKALLSKQVVH